MNTSKILSNLAKGMLYAIVGIVTLPVIIALGLFYAFTYDKTLNPDTCEDRAKEIVLKYVPIVAKDLGIKIPEVIVSFSQDGLNTRAIFYNRLDGYSKIVKGLSGIFPVFKSEYGYDYVESTPTIVICAGAIANSCRGSRVIFKWNIIRAIAHEMRHCYQMNVDSSYNKNYIAAEYDFKSYKKQDIEVDACSYASAFLGRVIFGKF